jgi:hypothetical protein
MQSALEVIRKAYETQPHLNLAVNDKQNCIGAWSKELGRYVIVASLTLTDQWVSMPYELLINGAVPVRNWVAVPVEGGR